MPPVGQVVQPWPLTIALQASFISAACSQYHVPLQVFMGMYSNETAFGFYRNPDGSVKQSNAQPPAVGPFQFTGSNKTNDGVIYPMTGTPNSLEFSQQATAAADYLATLYKQSPSFAGGSPSWLNALAAYNAGPRNYKAGLSYASAALAVVIPSNWKSALGNGPAFPGGAAGTGNTGTLLNDTSTSAFTVGDATNPDEDYWTAINRLALERYWYSFSDGETFYLADGPDLMKQTPALEIDRVADAGNISSMELTFDNTAWLYAVTHKKRRRAQRRTSLAKITSPVEAQIQYICKIDEVRAGDLVNLLNTGPGDGGWLVGNVRRSVFEVSSEINLVVALTPFTEGALNPAGVNTKNAGSLFPGGTVNSKGYQNPVGNWIVSPDSTSAGRIDMGVDGTITTPYLAPGDSTIVAMYNSQGPGSWRGYYIAGKLTSGPLAGKVWYVAEGITPVVSIGAVLKAGAPVGKPGPTGFGANGLIETGWANPSNPNQPLALSTGGYPHDGANTAAGNSFARFLKSTGAKTPGGTGPVIGTMPGGYP